LRASGVSVDIEIAPEFSNGFLNRYHNICWASRLEADVLHITGDIHYVALRQDKRKTILTIHDLEMLNRFKGFKRFLIKTFWFDLPIRRSRLVTCISKATKDKLISICKIPDENVRVVHNLLPGSFTFNPKNEIPSRPRILLIGTKPNKNIERIVNALQSIECEIVIIGKISQSQRNLISSSKVPFTNLIAISEVELEEQYRLADILCFASLEEGFGLPIIEAQAIGRPVVTSNVSSMPEIAGNGACLVDPMSTLSIRTGVQKVIDDTKFRHQLITNGFENQKRFRPSIIASQYLALYKELISDSNF
jgi:glycosyltransferase involved in cell wall biosynthesis